MNPISIKQTIRLKLDRLFHIDRKGEYGLMAMMHICHLTPFFLVKRIYLWKRKQVSLVGQ